MWSDTLLALERAHLLRLLAWGGMSAVAGTGLLAWLTIRHYDSALLRSFALLTSILGAVHLLTGGIQLLRIADRDFGSAIQLDRLLWLSTGLDIGVILAGGTLGISSWILGRRLGGVGAGIAVIVQGLGLLLLHLRFLSITGRIL